MTTSASEREKAWPNIENQLCDLLEVSPPDSQDDDVTITTTIDFRTMTLERVVIVPGSSVHTTTYLLSRRDDASWYSKEDNTLTEPPTGDQRRRTALQALMEEHGVGTEQWKDALAPAFVRALVELQTWHPISPSLQLWLEGQYGRLIQFFRLHPGLTPGTTHENYVAGLIDQHRIWEPPWHP